MIYVQLLSDQMFVKAIGLDDHKPIKRQFKKQNKTKIKNTSWKCLRQIYWCRIWKSDHSFTKTINILARFSFVCTFLQKSCNAKLSHFPNVYISHYSLKRRKKKTNISLLTKQCSVGSRSIFLIKAEKKVNCH